jgi:acyl carrier protein
MEPIESKGGENIMFEKIRACIASQLSIDEEEIKMESSFMNNLGADSLDIVELIMALEEEYDIEIPDEDVEKIATVGDIVEYIKAHSEV